MTVTFTLTAGSSATAAGPFNISGTTSGGALNDVSIATGVTKAQLLTGHSISNISETITGGTIASTGTTCPSSTTTWYVIAATPTPTPTATPVTSYSYQLGPSYTDANTTSACNGISGINGAAQDFLTEVYAATDQPGNVLQFFTDAGLTSGYAGESETHAYYRSGGIVTYTGQVSPSGFVTDRTVCPT
jgi:hypothetical protein